MIKTVEITVRKCFNSCIIEVVRKDAISLKTHFLKNTMLWGNPSQRQKGKNTYPLPYLILRYLKAYKITILYATFPYIFRFKASK